jgi:GTPase
MEIKQAVHQAGADVVLFNHELNPGQERNLERLLECPVLDRSAVILDIFAQRARTFEGKLQVELAQLQHLSTRLVRGWTHLERQSGGIGLRGPGETQLETDRRLIKRRIRELRGRLETLRRQRALGRKARRRAGLPTVLLVGYTNAGKSTLFNRLTRSSVYAADILFATLDPILRRVELAEAGPVIVGDTVGFIRDLPHELVAAFRATLEEVGDADLLLHVIDAGAPLSEQAVQIEAVRRIIAEIGGAGLPLIEVYNKIDRVPARVAAIGSGAEEGTTRVFLSAREGLGLDLLCRAIAERFEGRRIHRWLNLPAQAGRLRSWLYNQGAVREERADLCGGWFLSVTVGPRAERRLSRFEVVEQACGAPARSV